MMFFWILVPHRLFCKYQSFRETVSFGAPGPILIPPLPSTTTSSLKKEIIYFSEAVASTDKSTWRQNLEEHHQGSSLLSLAQLDFSGLDKSTAKVLGP